MSETAAIAVLNAPAPAHRRSPPREQATANFDEAVASLLAGEDGEAGADPGTVSAGPGEGSPSRLTEAAEVADPEAPDAVHHLPGREEAASQALLAAILPANCTQRHGQPDSSPAQPSPGSRTPAVMLAADHASETDATGERAVATGALDDQGVEQLPDTPLFDLGRLRLHARSQTSGAASSQPVWSAFRATVTAIATHFAPVMPPVAIGAVATDDAAARGVPATPALASLAAAPDLSAAAVTLPQSPNAPPAAPTTRMAAPRLDSPGAIPADAETLSPATAGETQPAAPPTLVRRDNGPDARATGAAPPTSEPTTPDAGRLGADQLQRIATLVSEAARDAAPQARAEASSAAQPLQPTPLRVVSLTLNPEHLGRVTLTIRLTGDRLSLRVEAEKETTAHMIEADSEALAELLDREGYGVETLVTAPLREPMPAAASQPASNPGSATAPNGGAGSERQAPQHTRDEPRNGPSGSNRKDETYAHEEAAPPGRPGRLYV